MDKFSNEERKFIVIDFHTHTILSDGDLIPSELARRAEAIGYRALGIADHVDGSNIDFIIPRLASVCRDLSRVLSIEVYAGAEVTHVPPRRIAALVERCRELGAEYIVVHGETIVEPVAPGTLDAALEVEPDLIAHPGLITLEQAGKAAERGIYLEISCRVGHCLSNGRVARIARETGAKLIVGTDAHEPSDLVTKGMAAQVALGAGLSEEEVKAVMLNAEHFLNAVRETRKRKEAGG